MLVDGADWRLRTVTSDESQSSAELYPVCRQPWVLSEARPYRLTPTHSRNTFHNASTPANEWSGGLPWDLVDILTIRLPPLPLPPPPPLSHSLSSPPFPFLSHFSRSSGFGSLSCDVCCWLIPRLVSIM